MKNLKLLNPLTDTGFLLKDCPCEGSDILFDLSYRGESGFADCLAEHGSHPDRIRHIFITHFHGDHYLPDVAWDLVQRNATLYMETSNWEAHFEDTLMEACFSTSKKIEKSGRLRLLALNGDMDLEGCPLRWHASPHGNTMNLSYRIRNLFISGDVSYPQLFAPENRELDDFLSLAHPEITVAAFQMTQISREDMKNLNIPPNEITRINRDTGTLENLIAVMRERRFKPFFNNLREIIPHHIRRHEGAEKIREILEEIREEQGCSFEIFFESGV